MDDLRTHYKMGYAPNNCVMVVVGDVTADQVMTLARKYIEPIPSQPSPPAIRTKEPEQLGERRIIVKKAAQLPIQLVAFHVPDAKNSDDTVLEVMDSVLTAGESSRLYKRMVNEDQSALSVRIEAEHSLDPALFIFSMTPRAGVEPARTEKTLYEEIARLQDTLISASELSKAKNQLLAQHYRQLKTIAGRADLLGIYEVFYGDYNKLYTIDKDIEAVTAEDVQRVAKKYFSEKNRTVATLIPESK